MCCPDVPEFFSACDSLDSGKNRVLDDVSAR